jgi:hypothetical protein
MRMGRIMASPWKLVLALIGTFVLFPTVVPALDRDSARSCSARDLLGLWEMVRLIPRGSERIYERFLFQDDGIVQHTSSVQPAPGAEKGGPAEAVDIMAWTVYSDGWLELQRAGVPYPESCACHYLMRNDKDALGLPTRRGQVILTYMRDGKPALQKLLRRLP